MAEIAGALQRALRQRREQGTAGVAAAHLLARGEGWTVTDFVCTSGPQDRSFEEAHAQYCIAVVLAGSFQYRSPLGREVMTPGSVMLGNRGQPYACGHEHAEGDRCVSFLYTAEYFERLVAAAGVRTLNFAVPRLPPLRSLAPTVARAGAGVVQPAGVPWEEIGVRLAAHASRAAAGLPPGDGPAARQAEARVTRIVRAIDRYPDAALTLGRMAREAGLSPYHFLRTFERVTGITPHQYLRRARLRNAALRLTIGRDTILDVALACGFGDVSNFNRAFRAEFGVAPRAYARGGGA